MAKPKKSSKPAREKKDDAETPPGLSDAPGRALWSGTLGFGLLQIPVGVYPLERSRELSFRQLDGRDLSPVGYKRYNKATGNDVPYDEIVRGYEIRKGEYVVVSDDELRAANVEATQSIDILDFVDPTTIPAAYFETPYLLAPQKRGEKAYEVLLQALRSKGRAAIATVVLRQRQHLAAVLAEGDSLVLEILRFAHELRPLDAKRVAGTTTASARVTDRERDMAEALVEDMTVDWDPAKYRDSYRDDVLAMIEKKAETGEAVAMPETKTTRAPADVADLTELLRKSLRRSTGPAKQTRKAS
jgi:DNA end-binding protein Ku